MLQWIRDTYHFIKFNVITTYNESEEKEMKHTLCYIIAAHALVSKLAKFETKERYCKRL